VKRIVPSLKKITLNPGHAVAGETRLVPVGDVHVLENLNLRVKGTPEYDEAVDEFAASIAANGFYADKPLAGYLDADGKVIVIDGHRRLEAIQRLNNASLDGDIVGQVPVVLKSEDSTLPDLTIAMIQSSSGKELTMFEKGIGVRRLMADGMDKDEIARRLGVTTKSVDNYIAVASVPAKARDLLLDGKVTSTHVLRAKGDAAKLQAMVDRAAQKGRSKAREGDAAEMTPTVGPNDIASVTTAIGPVSESYPNIKPDDGLTFTVAIVKDADMGAVMRQIAAEVRKVVPHDQGDEDTARVDGVVTVSISLTQPAPVKRVRKAKQEAVQVDGTEPPVPAELAHAVVDEL
jgi:ParB-like chromosome segregation protein Spo0J